MSTLIADPCAFFVFPCAHFFNSILASWISGTFGFAPTHKGDPSAKLKEPILPTHKQNGNLEYNIN